MSGSSEYLFNFAVFSLDLFSEKSVQLGPAHYSFVFLRQESAIKAILWPYLFQAIAH